jgi:hypothetical protein
MGTNPDFRQTMCMRTTQFSIAKRRNAQTQFSVDNGNVNEKVLP